MSDQHSKPVLVGVGYEPVDAALVYAAHEAGRVGRGLRLLHVVHELAQAPEAILIAREDLEGAGRLALAGAEQKAHDLLGDDVEITSELVHGTVVGRLVEAASQASSVVLEQRRLTRVERVVTRSVSAGVAAHARVPVVSVPAGWSPVHAEGTVATVTVGVDVPERAGDLLRVAVAEARTRDARLRILHTWFLSGAYADLVMPPEEEARWSDRATNEINALLHGLGSDGPTGEVVIEVRHDHPSDALVESGRSSDLVIVGRHDPLIPLGSHLGPVARSVLREATCPVMLADPSPSRHHSRTRPAAAAVG